MKEIIKEIIEFDLDEGRMDYLDDMIDVFSKDGCEMVDILFDRFLMGNIFNPRNLSSNFSKLLELKGLRHIRFHDLRHSCASLLLANDVPMKQIQEWLGHSDISTTANIYSHLDYKSKLTSANVMDNVLTLPETEAVGWQT